MNVLTATSCGYRISNEDRAVWGEWKGGAYAAVFDGHSGDELSRKCAERLGDIIRKCDGNMEKVFHELDNIECSDFVGTTATVVICGRGEVTVGHIGDSSAILVSESGRYRRLTRAHLASDEVERIGVMSRGGTVDKVRGVHRVGGCLMLSRSLGDRYLSGVGKTPDVATHYTDYRYCVLMSDGVTDVFTDAAIANVVRRGAGPALLVSMALDDGGRDNCTVIIVDMAPSSDSPPSDFPPSDFPPSDFPINSV